MSQVWNFIDNAIEFFAVKIFHLKSDSSMMKKLQQFIKFGIVGLLNTLISYFVYVVLVMLGAHYLLASLAGFFVSVLNAYYWNSKYVFNFNSTEKYGKFKALLKTFVSYAGTGMLLSNILLALWVEVIHIPEIIAPLINLVITIPLNFILNKFWAYKQKIRK